jgi:peptide deformylase
MAARRSSTGAWRANLARQSAYCGCMIARILVPVALFSLGCGGAPSKTHTPTSMSGPDIVQTGSPILRARATEVPAERIGTPEMQDLVKRMIATMRAAPGVGLAGPQIGVPLRVIVLEDREDLMGKLTPEERRERERVAFEPKVIFNPVLVLAGNERATFFEGCLSVNGFVGLVERSAEVDVSGLDEHARPIEWHTRGWPARILQHEVDHLDGTLYIDRMMTRSFSTAEQAKALYAGKSIVEIRRALGL